MVPSSLDEWTLEAVRALLEQHAIEPESFDFKAMLPDARDNQGKVSLREEISAFANSGGGFLIYGVKDDREKDAEARIAGVPASVDFGERFGNYPAECRPSIPWSIRNPPIALEGSKLLQVVHIGDSLRRPHGVPVDGHLRFYKRTNKGKEPMSLEELREMFIGLAERHGKLKHLQFELETFRGMASSDMAWMKLENGQFEGRKLTLKAYETDHLARLGFENWWACLQELPLRDAVLAIRHAGGVVRNLMLQLNSFLALSYSEEDKAKTTQHTNGLIVGQLAQIVNHAEKGLASIESILK